MPSPDLIDVVSTPEVMIEEVRHAASPPEVSVVTKPAVRARRRSRVLSLRRRFAAVGVAISGAVGALQFLPAPKAGVPGPFTRLVASPAATASPDAFGRSGAVRTLFALPGAAIQFPLTVTNPRGLRYRWISMDGRTANGSLVPLEGGRPEAPTAPGFYWLAVTGSDSGAVESIVEAPVMAVMAPFTAKVGGVLNGYRIGTYVSERLRADDGVPEGFVEVWPEMLDLQVSANLRLADFITHDARQEAVWPKYVALSPRLLDKLELVIAEVGRTRPPDRPLAVAVHSGFRTPAYNARVDRAARDSRHQHGDAVDVAIDANGDGRLTAADGQLVAKAVEQVERAHPDLSGGLGLYVSRRYRTPYVHIDARGARARWRG